MVKLEGVGDGNWFKSGVVRKMGDGLSAGFWRDRWRSDIPFCHLFPRLFLISTQKDCSVGEVWNSREENGS